MKLIACSNCNTPVSTDAEICPRCNYNLKPPPNTIPQQSVIDRAKQTVVDQVKQIATNQVTTNHSSALMSRYADAYSVTKSIIRQGNAIKNIGFILGVLHFLAVSSYASFKYGADFPVITMGVIVISGIISLIIGSVFHVIGVSISARGQFLRAILDNTVGNSPFLTNDLKARIMSL